MMVNSPRDGSIWLIGCGNMSGAMLRRWLDTGLPARAVTVVRPSGVSPAPDIRTLTTIPADEPAPDILLLGVKPQKLDDVAASVAAAIGARTLIVSILAGTDMAALRTRFPTAGAIVRAMPNTPVAIGRGVVALHGDPGSRAEELASLMAPLGLVEWIGDEGQFGLVTALAGSGPAFLFRFIAALTEGAIALGMDADQALRLALATVDGAAGLALGSTDRPDVLADRVASPGGMTRKGLDVLDQGGALADLVARMLAATLARERELAAAAR